MNDEEFDFYKDSDNWDTIPNLQLLNDRLNEHKNTKPLAKWVEEDNVDLGNQLIPIETSLDIKDFKNFLIKRRALLKQRLKRIVE